MEEHGLRLAVKKREYVAIDEVWEVWTKQVARAKDLLRNKFEMELPPILSWLDATANQEECRKAIDEVLIILHAAGGGGGTFTADEDQKARLQEALALNEPLTMA